jgi:hypothetical protein
MAVPLGSRRLAETACNVPIFTDKDLSKDLVVLANGCEMLCIEVAFVRGKKLSNMLSLKKRRLRVVGFTDKRLPECVRVRIEGGFYLTKLLDRAEVAKEVQATLGELGWLDTARS